MFPHEYFAARFFAERYFPPTVAAPVATPSSRLPALGECGHLEQDGAFGTLPIGAVAAALVMTGQVSNLSLTVDPEGQDTLPLKGPPMKLSGRGGKGMSIIGVGK